AYLDRARSTDFFATLKATMLHALAPRPGTRVADLGCGTGDDTAAAAAIGAFAIGLDLSEPHIAEAHRRHRSTGVAFLVADGHHLPLAADRLDGCLVERTLQHVAEPQTVVAEIARVLRRGGRLVVSEPDWASTTVVGGDVAVGNAIVQWWIDGHHRHPRLGQ